MSEQKMCVGFVGLGIMGQPMSANVLKAGFPLAEGPSKSSGGSQEWHWLNRYSEPHLRMVLAEREHRHFTRSSESCKLTIRKKESNSKDRIGTGQFSRIPAAVGLFEPTFSKANRFGRQLH